METNKYEDLEHVTSGEKKKRKKVWILILLILLLLGIGGGYLLWNNLRPKSQYELDRNALEGFLPGKTEDEIKAELNRYIKEGFFNVSMNPQMTLKDGKLDVHIENVPANHYDTQVDIYLYPHLENQEDAELIYHSGIIKPEFYIDEVEVKTSVAPGTYNAKATFHAITRDEKQEEMGSTDLNVIITVQ